MGDLALCVCGSGEVAIECCLAIHSGTRTAATAVALMRSRYAAFVLQDAAYLMRSWHPDTRPGEVSFDPQQRWLGLKIKRVEAGGEYDATGVVEFAARYKIDGRGHRLEEVSEFVRYAGLWVYLRGRTLK